ncbi:MAG: DUF885 domain-containing protein [Planctomycetaceae bacterium]|nr:DUF885 domain-containing protein [Planctomycetaceae bacterium]
MRLMLTLILVILASQISVPVQAKDSAVTEKFHQILDEHWEWQMREQPTYASNLGDKRYNDRWPDLSSGAFEKRHKFRQQLLSRLDGIDRQSLSEADQINYRLFQREIAMEVEGWQYRYRFVPLNQRGGIQTSNELADALSFQTEKDYEDWINRLRSFDTYMDQTIALMQQGVDHNIVHAYVVMKRVPAQIRRQIVEDPTKSPFYKPFQSMASNLDDKTNLRLQGAAQAAIRDVVVPSYKKFDKFFNEVYLPACFEKVGFSQIPDGQNFYAYRARLFTTTDLTPEQIHEIGLSEVKRIRNEMEKIMQEVKFEGTFREFLEYLRTDPQFYYKNENDLFQAVQAVCKQVDPQLVKLFKTLPRMPYGVEAIPAAIAPDTTAAYYRRPASDGSRAGSYFFNLYKPEHRPKYTIEVLSLHEAVPGHHLQIALAMELEDLPAFRRFGGYTAYIEGWGLYSESLGSDLGLYKDPYSRFGQLTYEMWRAIRLVVDTGMHSFGWSRDQAINLFLENTAKSRLDIVNEVDRYIAWPGQALAYKIGELKIQELRSRAEKKLGKKFDIREFHEAVLGHGAVTLDVLEEQIDAWIISQEK